MNSTDPFGLCPLGFLNLDWSTIGHALLDVVGIFWDGADLINAMWYKAEGNDFIAGVCLLSALSMLGSFAGGTIKAVATGTKYLNKAETVAKYLTLGTKLVSHTAQATMSGIDTYYAAVDAYEAYQAGELGAEEIINLGLAATGTILSTGAAISSGRGLYKLMGSDGVGCKVLTGITGEPHCFVAGTLVFTEEGQRAIEEVEAGDKVWAFDEETGEKGLKEVEEVFVSETDKLIHVETDREEIVTTELHPFYVEGIGFVQAGCLREGYELVCLDGSRESITGVTVEWLEEAITVYNFEVADYHTYYVGDGDVLVHNKCANPSGSDGNQKPKGWRVGDPIDNLTRTGAEPSWNTVRSRYWKNEAYFNPGDYSESNLKLMQKGKAPRHNIYDVPMELHHINGRNIDNPHNVDNLLKVWPWEHAEIDQYRHYTGPQP